MNKESIIVNNDVVFVSRSARSPGMSGSHLNKMEDMAAIVDLKTDPSPSAKRKATFFKQDIWLAVHSYTTEFLSFDKSLPRISQPTTTP